MILPRTVNKEKLKIVAENLQSQFDIVFDYIQKKEMITDISDKLESILLKRWKSENWQGCVEFDRMCLSYYIGGSYTQLSLFDTRRRLFPKKSMWIYYLFDLFLSTYTFTNIKLIHRVLKKNDLDGIVVVLPVVFNTEIKAFEDFGYKVTNCICWRDISSFTKNYTPIGVNVREAKRSDDDILVKLHLEDLKFHIQYDSMRRMIDEETMLFMQKIKQKRENEDLVALVGENNGEIIGFLAGWLESVSFFDTPPGFPTGIYGHLDSMFVKDSWRNKGVGTALFSHATELFKQKGATMLKLNLLPTNPLSSKFWRNNGFKPHTYVLQWRKHT